MHSCICRAICDSVDFLSFLATYCFLSCEQVPLILVVIVIVIYVIDYLSLVFL